MKCFYHDDLDGKAAAFVVARYEHLCTKSEPTEVVAMNYGKSFPLDVVAPGERVWIVDYSIDPLEMITLLDRTCDVVWIDHHKTAIAKYADFHREIKGIREDGTAGCVLAWKFCFPNEPLPRVIELVGDRDVWAWKYGEETANFCSGAQMENTHPHSDFWVSMLDHTVGSGACAARMKVCERGKTINEYRAQFYADMLKSIGFEATLDGHSCLCLCAARVGSENFGDSIKEYDICSSFFHDGKQFMVSLYSEKIDVSEIAKARGGGGHRGASGFQCAELPYEEAKNV
jgi:oligoribonuclease NrnB/cAMP/cGMP phosphodiesterase (DHH superfamily)